MAVEKLLGITDEVPVRAQVIRVMMMELNRISSHLVWLGTGGLEIGALSAMLYAFRERELILDIFEMVTRPTHEPRVYPARRRYPGSASGRGREDPRIRATDARKSRRVQQPAHRAANLDRPAAGHRLSRCQRMCRARRHRPLLRAAGLPWDLRKSQPYCGYETYDFDVPTQQEGDCFARFLVRLDEIRESVKIVEQCLDRLRPRPGHGRGQEDRVACATRSRCRRNGQLPRPHPAHHGDVDGVAHSPLQAGHRGIPRTHPARCTCRSSHHADNSAFTSLVMAGRSRIGSTCASRRS